MQWIYIVLMILLGIVILSVIPMRLNVSMYWNIGYNLGVVAISIWGITVSCFQIEITKSAINIIRSKGKDRALNFEAISQNAVFMNFFLMSIFRYISIREISIFLETGKSNDACFTNILNGFLLQLLYNFYAVLFSIKGDFRSYMSVDGRVDTNKLSLTGTVSIVCCPIVLLFSLVRALFRIKRMVKVYERV